MFTAQIKKYLGADYSFNSHSFKWCYYQAVHFARQALYLRDYLDCIVIEFTGDIMVAVSRTGITIDTPNRVFDIEKERK